MRCPKCHSVDDKVIDSRMSRNGDSIRRRRECTTCGTRFTTREMVELEDIFAVKRNGSREPLDAEKILRGIMKACEKRDVSRDAMETAVEEIMADLTAQNSREISTKLIGLKVMEKLQHLDPVAYVRFASVYREFQDVGEFLQEIQHLERRGPLRVLQPELFST